MFYHILLKNEWESIKTKRFYEPQSLIIEGFIHLSTFEQLNRTIDKYFKGQSIIVLKVSVSEFDSYLRLEKVGDDRFPHYYSKILVSKLIEFR